MVFKISVILCMCLCECPYLWDGIYMTHLVLGEICSQYLGESLVSVWGLLVSIGLWFYLDVHLCGCASVWMPASAWSYGRCPLVVESPSLAFSVMFEKFLAVPSLFRDLSASTLSSQRVIHTSVFADTHILDSTTPLKSYFHLFQSSSSLWG